ncbi:DUF4209 domain-containing protein [Acinetobacter sp. CWB-G5]|uniref:DUF4209 domain-containing protein n=1 Tax=Acinetobacter sp. CWB-G5 TaxID=2855444 RepID=UPI001C47297B|nr:DUF4209 domain-containing protein [Acinetobacter sp. CWB-G5]MBV7307246.1 DUF4209 domain-containing protein [Acinetobacter sp. CWB-G5]
MKHIEQLNKIIETDVKFALLDDIQWEIGNLEYKNNIHDDLKAIKTIIQTISLDAEKKSEPYLVKKPIVKDGSVTHQKTGENIDDYFNGIFNLSNELISSINSPALRARLYDLKFITNREKKYENSQLALESYSAIPLTISSWAMTDTPSFFRRALTLAKQTKNNKVFENISKKIYQTIIECNDFEEFQILITMAMLLNDFDYFKKNDCEEIILKFIQGSESLNPMYDKKYIFIRCYDIYMKTGYSDKGAMTLLNGIKKIIEETQPTAKEHTYLIDLKRILECKISKKQRSLLDFDNTINILNKKILLAGKDVINMINKNQGEKIDITEEVNLSINRIKKLNLIDSLNQLFLFQKNTFFFSTLKSFSEKDLKEPSFFAHLFTHETAYSADGRIIHNSPQRPETLDNEDLIKNYLTYRKFFWFNQLFTYHVFSSIFPAFNFIINKFKNEINENFISDLIDNSALVPEDRKELFKLGIGYGFNFKFCEAIHILAPQLENLVRVQLKTLGVSTIVYDKETSVQNEISLSSLMQKPEVSQLFDENTIFEIKALFTENIGFNLRNNVAHGLLNDNSINRIDTFYAWLLVLRIISLNKI